MVPRFCLLWGDLRLVFRREWEGYDDCGGFVNRMVVFVGSLWMWSEFEWKSSLWRDGEMKKGLERMRW